MIKIKRNRQSSKAKQASNRREKTPEGPMTIEQLKAKLFDRNNSVVSAISGVNPITISRIKTGAATSCSERVRKLLTEYFRNHA